MENKTFKKYIRSVEKDLIFNLIMGLRHGDIDTGKAEVLARQFLVYMPPKDKMDMVMKLRFMASAHKEFLDLYIKYANSLEKEVSMEKVQKAQMLIKKGYIDLALESAKGGTWK